MSKRIYFFWMMLIGGCSHAPLELNSDKESVLRESVAVCIGIQSEISNPWITDWLLDLDLGDVEYEAQAIDHPNSSHYIVTVSKKTIELDGESIACHVSKKNGQLLMAAFYKGSPESALTREVSLVSSHNFSGGLSHDDIETIVPTYYIISPPWGRYGN